MPKAPSSNPIWHLLTLMFGALLPLSFAPFDWWPIGILCVGCFAMQLRSAGAGKAFVRAFFFGLGMFGTGVSWVYASIHGYGGASTELALGLTSLFIIALALVFALPFLLYGSLDTDSPVVVLLAFPSIWVLGELWRGWFLTGFPWLYLGYGHLDTWLANWAPIVGVHGISWVVAFCGGLLSLVLERKRYRRIFGRGVLLTILIWGGGLYLNSKTWTEPAADTLSVVLVQPNLPLEQKWDEAALGEILNGYLQQTAAYWGETDVVIWPESAIPRFQDELRNFLDHLNQRAAESGTAVVTGIPFRENGRYFNSVISLGKGSSGTYHKRRLVPFGEYVPLESMLRGTIRFFDLPMSSFSAGPDRQRLLWVKGQPVATAICYEIVYPGLVSESAADASMILTVSNDTWFGDTLGPHQHLEMARMRALENGKPVLRATNGGITAVIDQRGRITARLPQFETDVLKTNLLPFTGTTPLNRLGLYPVFALCVFLILIGSLAKAPPEPAPPSKDRRRKR